MILRLKLENLRNPEHLQFMTDGCKLFLKHNLEAGELSPSYEELNGRVKLEENAMAIERANEKIGEKNRADAYRDKLHSKLFNHLKTILYDEEDPKYDAAQRVMKVVKSAGNPTRLAENAESAMITALGNKLEPYRADLAASGAQEHLDKLLEANRRFMELETECRQLASTKSLAAVPSMSDVRRQADTVYRRITGAINTFIGLRNMDTYKELVSDMNVLVEKYDRVLSQRKSSSKNSNNGDQSEKE
ncbi:MAG: DUF6261 family protein [Bacteroidales bacterium]|jgi:hypothetical protein|nr:DUF6261 family protein [Bacteroidales bacterium]